MKLRLEHRKIGIFRFVSHLDWLNSLKRAIRRALIPISYSSGFSPQMRINLGIPLPLGVEGLKEYFDLELEKPEDPVQVMYKLNRELPEELHILRCEVSPSFEISKFVNFSIYDLFLREERDLDFKALGDILYKLEKRSTKTYRIFLFQKGESSGIVKVLFSLGLSWEEMCLIRRLGLWKFEGEIIINPFGEVEQLDKYVNKCG
ncbi:MAG: TIGR03936 family radical SAM-associated protein [Synergistetes bacterium]|nr:TIGR03936 family radical SAM-associated protein [Synergistota bacterium]